MFKQDYEALAALIKVQRTPNPGADVQEALDNLALDMAQYLASQSPFFDTRKFLAAAGAQ
jgi:hypothetical protein